MKRAIGAVLITGLFFIMPLAAQEEASLDWDISTIFDAPAEERPKEDQEAEETARPSAVSLLKRRGYTFDASFRFIGGLMPGWNQTPWYFDGAEKYSTNPVIRMRASFGIDAQISEALRAKVSVFFEIPPASGAASNTALRFELGDFFFDYSLYDVVFIRAGKFSLNWGISRNFSFTNLLSRIPDVREGSGQLLRYRFDPYLVKVDVPIGIGGIQLLALTRVNLMGRVTPERRDFAFGGKYNLAHRLFDLDVGALYQRGMDTRAFASIKTTLWDFEIYNEWLGAIDEEKWNNFNGAVNLGFARDFNIFDKRLSVNAEVFYNAESKALWYSPETDIRLGREYRFLEGFNLAMNLLFRFGGKGNPRLFTQALYAVDQKSARLTPGFRLTPWQNVDVYLAVPMSLGSKESYYYKYNEDNDNRPFSVVMLVTVRGSVRAAHYQ